MTVLILLRLGIQHIFSKIQFLELPIVELELTILENGRGLRMTPAVKNNRPVTKIDKVIGDQ